MKIEFRTVENITKTVVKRIEVTIAAGLILFFCNNSEANAYENSRYEEALPVNEFACYNVHAEEESSLVLQMSDNRETTSEKMDRAFAKATTGNSTIELESAHDYVLSAVKDVDAEKIRYEYNAELDVVNYTLLLAHGYLLSVSKSLDLLDEDVLTFSIFHKRNLLLSDAFTAKGLADYMDKVQKRLNNA